MSRLTLKEIEERKREGAEVKRRPQKKTERDAAKPKPTPLSPSEKSIRAISKTLETVQQSNEQALKEIAEKMSTLTQRSFTVTTTHKMKRKPEPVTGVMVLDEVVSTHVFKVNG